ncbi:protein Wnt-4 isoform X1 [Drosophila pseudoobscura]|uniref:Protein Wnt n=1 Tax=Drosophila pseudoobscura pseudoobscura TaxID=46245 RepID=A0A6I8V808_DROPS|nr:protein Wnt-4 isoform X1 [Drosophila pseudoobscura]
MPSTAIIFVVLILCRLGLCQVRSEDQLLMGNGNLDSSPNLGQHSQHQHQHHQHQSSGINMNHNSTLLNTLMGGTQGVGSGGGALINQLGGLAGLGSSTSSAPSVVTGGGGGGGGVSPWHAGGGGMSGGGVGVPTHGGGGHPHGHALAGLANLGIIVPGTKGLPANLGYGGTMLNAGLPGGVGGGVGGMLGGAGMMGAASSNGMDMQSLYNEHFISEHTVMAVFTSQGQVGGPCRYMPATRRQNHQCRKETGLPGTLSEARRLATSHCEDQFRYDRWNCSIETRGKRNIFKKLYKETAFVHALTAAAMTHSIARACAEGRMTKCSCGPRKQNRVDQDFQWGGCNDNLKHGKRVTRSFLDLRGGDGDEVSEILRHDSEVGIEAVSSLMKDKCKCHGVSGSCSMKTCWKKMADFNATATLLRQKYNQAIRKAPNQRTKRQMPSSRMKKPKQRRKKPATYLYAKQPQQSQYTTLYYLETSPTYCSVTKDRQCLHPENCSNLCCGRGYTTQVFKQVEKCRCRFNNGRCCQLICDYCQRYEDKYFCK